MYTYICISEYIHEPFIYSCVCISDIAKKKIYIYLYKKYKKYLILLMIQPFLSYINAFGCIAYIYIFLLRINRGFPKTLNLVFDMVDC